MLTTDDALVYAVELFAPRPADAAAVTILDHHTLDAASPVLDAPLPTRMFLARRNPERRCTALEDPEKLEKALRAVSRLAYLILRCVLLPGVQSNP